MIQLGTHGGVRVFRQRRVVDLVTELGHGDAATLAKDHQVHQ